MAVVVLRGRGASEAQHLVASLQDADIDVSPIEDTDTSRDAWELVNEVVIGLLVHSTYDLAKTYVTQWAASRDIKDSDVTVKDDEDDPDLGSSPEDN